MLNKRSSFLAFSAVLLLLVAGFPALAEDRVFLGIDITVYEGTFLVTKAVNVRAAPKTESEKLSTVKSGSRVAVVGRAKGGAGWMAIQQDGKDYGFVYAPALLPTIDGTLNKHYTGTLRLEQHSPCGYTFEFRGKNTLEGEDISFSDYEIIYRCNEVGRPFKFLTPMFMSEVPFGTTSKPVFQISIDLREIDNDSGEIVSTSFDYYAEEKKIVFTGVSVEKLGRVPLEKERQVDTLAEALAAAVEIAPDAWGAEIWKQLTQMHLNAGK